MIFLLCNRNTTSSRNMVFGILYILLFFIGLCHCVHVASSQENVGICNLDLYLVKNNLSITGCMPFSHKYLTGYYIELHKNLPGTDFRGSTDCCKGLVHDILNVIGVPYLQRHLVGEGSHRKLVSTMKFCVQPDVSWFDAHSCEALIIERLLVGVFADPFELQHLVQRQVYLDAAVFGDTNLESPSALSNQSIVEVHMAIEHDNISSFFEIITELPLHARYPPLDEIGYSRVEIGAPDILMRCRPKSPDHEAFPWILTPMNVGSVDNVTWFIPCGNQGHTRLVSTITFISALFSALVIVFSSIYLRIDNSNKSF